MTHDIDTKTIEKILLTYWPESPHSCKAAAITITAHFAPRLRVQGSVAQ